MITIIVIRLTTLQTIKLIVIIEVVVVKNNSENLSSIYFNRSNMYNIKTI